MKTLSVCDVLADPLKYNAQAVTMRGVVTGTDEGTWLTTDVPCTKPLITHGFVWPQVLWVEVADVPSVVSRVGFRTDVAASMKIDRAVRRLNPDNKKDRIWLTYVGVFETRDYKPTDVGSDRAYGFGHLNS